MYKFVDFLRPKLDEFIKKLHSKKEYSSIQVLFEYVSNNRGLTFESNAGFWLDNSFMFQKEISDFIKEQYLLYSKKENITIKMSFSQIQGNITQSHIIPQKSQNDKNTKTDNMEQVIFYPEKPKYKLEDVILPSETIASINDAIATIENFDIVYNKWNFKSKEPAAKTIICLYGAPGTGKTMCAHAIADRLGKNILIASYADIQSQYVGVGPKNLRSVFKSAEENNALLFFDEADSFLRKRTSDNSNSASMHYNSMTNEMMKHLEDFNGVVIFATNLTENTDEAFKTRISFSIEFKEPDENCRARIIKNMIPPQVPLFEEFFSEDYIELSRCCDGLVGRDIRNSIKATLSVGAQNNSYPFTKEHFIEGFKKYKEDKISFENNSNSKKGKNATPMDIYTTNDCIHNLLTYAAWVDGKENDIESEYLKLFSNVLNRSKLIINSVNDLPEFEDICCKVFDEELKKKVLRYFAFFMAMTKQKDSLYEELCEKLSQLLNIGEPYTANLRIYYEQVKKLSQIQKEL